MNSRLLLASLGFFFSFTTGCQRENGASVSQRSENTLTTPASASPVADATAKPGLPADSHQRMSPPVESEKRLEALRGNDQSASELIDHYSSIENPSEADVWMHVAAENGDVNGMYRLAIDLRNRGGTENCVRAVFWLSRAQAALRSKASRGAQPLSPEVQILVDHYNKQIADLKGSNPACR